MTKTYTDLSILLARRQDPQPAHHRGPRQIRDLRDLRDFVDACIDATGQRRRLRNVPMYDMRLIQTNDTATTLEITRW